jgi:hypothetical protein
MQRDAIERRRSWRALHGVFELWDNIPHTDLDRQALAPTPETATRHALVEAGVLTVMRPLVRLLIRHGVGYPAFASALKRVFLDAAKAELDARGMARTDSALSLLSGVHRRDVRTLERAMPAAKPRGSRAPVAAPVSLVGEIAARWITDAEFLDGRRRPRALERSEFDALVAAVSSDVRPRAILDELQRLGAAAVRSDGRIVLASDGFAPRQGFAQMTELFAANLGDHAAAAVANLQDDANHLEQAMYADALSEASAAQLQRAAVKAWQQAVRPLIAQAIERRDADSASRHGHRHRVRFGVYFYSSEESDR